ncbi:indolepyruvate ferredoxin oxidoreductase family protein [Oceanicella actignis]|uniref:Indolepyruvate ferredoxin oxidoreductase n=1 Tax=Oceanicella actignis TaxID=1189325 RepID=A0A1M7TVK5_9RHOB|nr:indolepyruvate ferredoxin oxidoreductase family protein [Oceanicella actignis]SES80486.1 indolepyruvate ferredoxin oxidoreductase [Oceanicella actignis]SHN74752.1 indolepyruvate ferredoxin oxidoreductase [Oceanicella actignis]
MLDAAPALRDYKLDDRYAAESGRVFLTGTQALTRILIDQARRDRAAGLKTGGFVSGYRGSPLGGLDLELWRAKKLLDAHRIEFLPAVNEDLAVSAVIGSQQVETDPHRQVQGVFGMWYGKGPGVDRSGDALKHANAYGSSPHGGVLAVAGDDHGCVSSSMPHQSDAAFLSWFMPVLSPASVAEYLEFGEYGYALSRFSGAWVGFKVVSEIVESGASVELKPPRVFAAPDYAPPPGGLHYRLMDPPSPEIELRLAEKKKAIYAFAEANPIDRAIFGTPAATYGIVTTGKGHLDLMEALRLLGLDAETCRRIGIEVYKVGMVWPLARRDALNFVRGKREILVVEEKRGIVESQLKEYFYDFPGDKPQRMVGKHDENGERLIPWTGELSPRMLAQVVARRLDTLFPGLELTARAEALPRAPAPIVVEGATRTPYFCSGCPHNTSTRVPEGSTAGAGIGCHVMATWMNRNTAGFVQMGGEGVPRAGAARFTGNRHMFQNLGEGTWYHSGSMAIRQCLAAGVNITFKILYNDAVAMTGGQPVDGPVSVQRVAMSVRAEGVERIALVSDEPGKFRAADFPAGVTFHHRSELDAVQRELREVPGVSVLIYEQTCATEKRRRRKRGTMEDPPRFAVINELVCEGCGDCSVASNCLSVEPVETEFGRKRRVNLSSCNKDFSCLDGFCPSFVTVENARRRKKTGAGIDPHEAAARLPQPALPPTDRPWNLLVTGVGGTGVVTVGALISMAAHLEGRGASVLDFTGFAQKFGPVLSYLRIADAPEQLNQVRIDEGSADALIGCDAVVSASAKASPMYRPGMRAALNIAPMPTGDVVLNRDADLRIDERVARIAALTGAQPLTVDANAAAEALLGDAVFANVLMLGMAWQAGLVPAGLEALMRAIELNGVAPEANKAAFAWGRLAAADPEAFAAAWRKPDERARTLDEAIARRVAFLTDYQDAAYAETYRAFVEKVRAAEAPLGSEALTDAVARALFKLMAVKDEYEVARLHLDPAFEARLRDEFEEGFVIRHHLAPPLLPLGKDWRGRPRKRAFGPWVRGAFHVLARMKRLRGTALDPFGRTAERRMERALPAWYRALIERQMAGLTAQTLPRAIEIARAPMDIRGFGPVKAQAVEDVKARVAALEAEGAA